MKEILQYLFNHNTLTKVEAKAILTEIAQNKFNENEVTSFVTVFLMRSITLEELEGFCEALMQLCVKVDLGVGLADIVGTGGDGKNTFNISTLASFVVAGAGQKVAKHGNYGVSSVSGSSNVLEALGYQFKNNEADLKLDLEKANICFLHAPLFHPALKTVAPLRKGLGLKTFFNILGPLVNPTQPEFSVIGTYNLEIARLYQYLLQKQDRKFTLVHAMDGYDEVSLTEDTKLITNLKEKVYAPEDFGFNAILPEAIFGGDSIEKCAELFKNVLEGNGTEEQNAVVTANATVVLESTGSYGDYNNALTLAKNSLSSGKALECFRSLIN